MWKCTRICSSQIGCRSPIHCVDVSTLSYLRANTHTQSSSIKVKDGNTRSVAHFYRTCEIWPRLEQRTTLSPAARPLVAQVAKSLFMGGSGKVRLTTELHRLNWIAGQRCHIKIKVDNGTKKAVKRVTIALVRTTSAFHTQPTAKGTLDMDEHQTSTTDRIVAVESIEMGERVSRGQASAKGWWSGVNSGQTLVFSHFIVIPVSHGHFPRNKALTIIIARRIICISHTLTGSDLHRSCQFRFWITGDRCSRRSSCSHL